MNLKKVIARLLFVKFETCKNVSVGQSELVDNIIVLLNKQRYTIINSSDEGITFSGNSSKKNRLRFISEAAKKINFGVLTLQKTENETTIKLTSFRSTITEIVFLLGIVTYALFTSYWALLLLLLVLLRFAIWSNYNKQVSRRLISDIIK